MPISAGLVPLYHFCIQVHLIGVASILQSNAISRHPWRFFSEPRNCLTNIYFCNWNAIRPFVSLWFLLDIAVHHGDHHLCWKTKQPAGNHTLHEQMTFEQIRRDEVLKAQMFHENSQQREG